MEWKIKDVVKKTTDFNVFDFEQTDNRFALNKSFFNLDFTINTEDIKDHKLKVNIITKEFDERKQGFSYQVYDIQLVQLKCAFHCRLCSNSFLCDECENRMVFFEDEVQCRRPYKEEIDIDDTKSFVQIIGWISNVLISVILINHLGLIVRLKYRLIDLRIRILTIVWYRIFDHSWIVKC